MESIPGTSFVLMGAWDTTDVPAGKLAIRFVADNGRTHYPWNPDTIAVLQAMEAVDFTGKRVLDFGTGSGILAIAAALRGASVDVAEYVPAIRAAAEANFTANGVVVGTDSGGSYDVILANLGDAAELDALVERCDLLIGTASTTKVRVSGGRGERPVYKPRAQDVSRKLQTRGRTTEIKPIDEEFAVVIG